MIQLEQVRNLEQKVKQAVGLISRLKTENDFLKGRLTDYEVRIKELENLISSSRNSQSEIEEGIINALEELDNLESSSSSPVPEMAAQHPVAAADSVLENPSSVSEDTNDLFTDTIDVEPAAATAESEYGDTGSLFDEPESTSEIDFEKKSEEEPTLGIF